MRARAAAILLTLFGPGSLDTLAASPDEVQTVALGKDLQLVATNRERIGTLTILDHGKVRWTVSSDSAAPGCWRGAEERPCAAERIGLLPPDAGGAPRFYVQAIYAQEAGGTVGHQLSLWRWKNGEAETFYTTDFITGGDMRPQGVTVTGNELDLVGKSYWPNLSMCGGCAGRQIRHHLRITPTGAEYRGTDSLNPEVDAVDDLIGRLGENRATDNIATPEAAAILKKSWHGKLFASDPVVTDHAACIAPDDNPALTFRFAPSSTGLKITAIEPGRCS